MELTSYIVNFLKTSFISFIWSIQQICKKAATTVVCLHTICCGLLHLPRFSHHLIWIKYFFSIFFLYVSFISITISQCHGRSVSTNHRIYENNNNKFIVMIVLFYFFFCCVFAFLIELKLIESYANRILFFYFFFFKKLIFIVFYVSNHIIYCYYL